MYRNRLGRLRLGIQLLSTAFFNGYYKGFLTGKLYTGKGKNVCVPVLNCYSCPGAIGACPIGALQAILGQRRVPFYVLGSIMLFGLVLGRIVCGFLCPFGLVQDLLHRIPTPKFHVPQRIHRVLCYVKYVLLGGFVVILPVVAAMVRGIQIPYFCKYVCPAGTLSGGVVLSALNPQLRSLLGVLFGWKVVVLVGVVVLAVFIPRPFCRYICPLGAFYGLFHKVSIAQLTIDKKQCIDCGKCEQVCPMQVEIRKEIRTPECIQCGACKEICPVGAIRRQRR
ncbi:4Fe-4S binding domain-containing protein [Lachnospiraceae bacterium XBB1006]|nr:4Fe-4S binding domain-containing protein [Lachnospiraceae bacterium XBB1006]